MSFFESEIGTAKSTQMGKVLCTQKEGIVTTAKLVVTGAGLWLAPRRLDGSPCENGPSVVTVTVDVMHLPSGVHHESQHVLTGATTPSGAPGLSSSELDLEETFRKLGADGPWSCEFRYDGFAVEGGNACPPLAYFQAVLGLQLEPKIEIRRIPGLVAHAPGSLAYAGDDPKNGGRLFIDHSVDAARPPDFGGADYTPDRQRIKLVCEVHPEGLDPGKLRVRWLAVDPDDPGGGEWIDPYGPSGRDNTGAEREDGPSTFQEKRFGEADHALAPSAVPTDDPLGAAPDDPLAMIETTVRRQGDRWTSSAYYYASDDGGDDFLFEAVLIEDTKVIDADKLQGPVTMWRYRRVGLHQMTPAPPLSFDLPPLASMLRGAFAPAYVELDFHPVLVATPVSPVPLGTDPLRARYADAHGVPWSHDDLAVTVFGIEDFGPGTETSTGNATTVHAFIAQQSVHKWATSARQAPLSVLQETVIHELAHTVGGVFGAPFHTDHSSPCALASDYEVEGQPRAPRICDRHVSMLRDRGARRYVDYKKLHDPEQPEFDSEVGR